MQEFFICLFHLSLFSTPSFSLLGHRHLSLGVAETAQCPCPTESFNSILFLIADYLMKVQYSIPPFFLEMGLISSSYFTYSGDGNESSKIIGESEPNQKKEGMGQHQTTPQHEHVKRSGKMSPKNCLPMLGDGKFEVGCADIMIDESTADGKCGIFARIFYPSNGHDPEKVSTATAKFLSWKPETEYLEGLAEYREMSTRKMNFFFDWVLGDKRVPIQWQIPFAEGTDKFPVAVFSHGISGNRFFYTTFCASLASHGFVVAALEHRDGSSCYTYELKRDSEGNLVRNRIPMKKLPHGEEEYDMRITQVRRRVDETLRMVELFEALNRGLDDDASAKIEILLGNEFDWTQLKGRLDVKRAVSIGHSFGGASAITACAVNKIFNSCVILDGWLYPFEQKYYTEVTQPVLMLCASTWQWPINVKRLLHLREQGGSVGKAMFTMSDIVHQTFSDFGLLCPGRVGRYFGLQGDLDPEFTGNAIMEMTATFLQNPTSSMDKLREIITTNKYDKFIQEGTNLSQEELDKIDAKLIETPSVEIGEDEERKIAEGEVDANEMK